MSVVRLRVRERLSADPVQLELLVRQFGERGAERRIGAAMDEIADCVARAWAHCLAEDVDGVRAAAAPVARLARDIGLCPVARVARDVASSCRDGDMAAVSATLDRLTRLSESGVRAIGAAWA